MTKDEMIKNSLWQVTIYAAFQRAKIYSDSATDEDKKALKQSLKNEVAKIIINYSSPVSEAAHFSNISLIAKNINTEWSFALSNRAISIGVIQKALNLYLKLMWCLNEIPEPPHCPLDKVIIDKLAFKHRKSWTKITNIETYEELINQLKELSGDKSLAAWELEEYEKP
ncbi:hypothetical protein Q4489_11080 [Thalassotalea sp. 1_MG-2023]|uniref:hypothetical protein n=1 Tax=Thalassotalea sp. 1_MG-2023 TaxID=3062680 RepID=UPI0026E33346|nr:hypothetical protein [Thalassotalea sp. 1_MG-2023]MDO6427562.1 hypothetical protein [Thalassotalea sp. 1_MG-2023]